MSHLLLLTSLLAGWIGLNIWILPLLGIPTCLGGACSRVAAPPPATPNPVDKV